MTAVILRRRKLGLSVKHMVALSSRISRVVRNDRVMPQGVDLVIRWGTTSNVDCPNVVNTAAAIHEVNDKSGFRQILMSKWADGGCVGLPLCPETWVDGDIPLEDFQYNFPVVVRPRTHAQGKHVYLCRTEAELRAATARCGAGWYASKYINKVKEYRVTFVQGRVVWVADKTPGNPNAIAWNVSQGGRFDNVRWDDWPLKTIRIAREAFLLSSLDFGAVDVMVDADGQPYVLEINSAPSQTSPYRQECMAKAFDYLIGNGKAAIPVVEQRGGWKKFIHPALTEEAMVV